MSYTKNTWSNGDVITAEKLNNMETGIDSVTPDMIIQTDADIAHETLSSSNTTVIGDYATIVSKMENGEFIDVRYLATWTKDEGSAGIFVVNCSGRFTEFYAEATFNNIILKGSMYAAGYNLIVEITINENGFLSGRIIA